MEETKKGRNGRDEKGRNGRDENRAKEKEIQRIRVGPQEASVTCENRFGHCRVPKRACVI